MVSHLFLLFSFTDFVDVCGRCREIVVILFWNLFILACIFQVNGFWWEDMDFFLTLKPKMKKILHMPMRRETGFWKFKYYARVHLNICIHYKIHESHLCEDKHNIFDKSYFLFFNSSSPIFFFVSVLFWLFFCFSSISCIIIFITVAIHKASSAFHLQLIHSFIKCVIKMRVDFNKDLNNRSSLNEHLKNCAFLLIN